MGLSAIARADCDETSTSATEPNDQPVVKHGLRVAEQALIAAEEGVESTCGGPQAVKLAPASTDACSRCRLWSHWAWFEWHRDTPPTRLGGDRFRLAGGRSAHRYPVRELLLTTYFRTTVGSVLLVLTPVGALVPNERPTLLQLAWCTSDRLAHLAQPCFGAALDEQGNEVPDRNLVELGAGLAHYACHLVGRHLRELLGQPIIDFADRTILV
jgi:hypothetical protein